MTSQSIKDQNKFYVYTGQSALLHFGLVLVFLIFMSLSFIIGRKKSLDIKIIESAVRVDVVSMPKMTLKELRSLETVKYEETDEKTITTIQKEPAKEGDFLKKKKKVDLKNLLKSLSKKKVSKKKVKKKKTNLGNVDFKKLVLEGNKVSAGTSLVGSGKAADLTEYNKYLLSLPDHVRPNWTLPSYLTGRDLKCRIQVFLSAQGKLLKAIIYESSGDDEYDQRALRAVDLSSPFPKPDKAFLKNVVSGEIVLGFPL